MRRRCRSSGTLPADRTSRECRSLKPSSNTSQASQCGCRGAPSSASRGAAPGPSGCTNEHLRLLLETEEDMQLLHHAVQRLALGDVPDTIARTLRLGRMVALRKPNGRVRGLVMGDTFRRLVARTLAQQFSAAFDTACRPFQFALGCCPSRPRPV